MPTPDSLYREFRSTLRRYLARRVSHADDVEDVLQDVFVRVTRNAQSLNSVREPLAWLYTLTQSALVDHVRKQRNQIAIGEGDAESLSIPPDNDIEDEFSACLLPLIEKLPSKYQDAIRFVDMEGGRQTELASVKGLTVSAAKSRVQRGRKMLKDTILSCCQVEKDGLQNVTALISGDCQSDCC